MEEFAATGVATATASAPASSFSHLHVHSGFSFGDGSSSVAALVLRTAESGQTALALTDTNSVTGIPSLVRHCGKAGIKPIGGCDIVLEGGDHLTLLADGPRGFIAYGGWSAFPARRITARFLACFAPGGAKKPYPMPPGAAMFLPPAATPSR